MGGLAMIGYGLKPLLFPPGPVPMASATETPLVTDSATPTPSVSTQPSPTPMPSPSESFVPPTPVQLDLTLSPPKSGKLIVLGEHPEEIPILHGRCIKSFAPGNLEVQIKVPGFEVDERSLAMTGPQKVDVILKPLVGELDVFAGPGPIRVIVDGTESRVDGKGTVKLHLKNLKVGNHDIKVVKDGYYTKRKTISIKPEENPAQRFTLLEIPPPPPPPVYVAPAPGPAPGYYNPPPAPAPAPPPAAPAPANPYTF